MLKMGVSRLGTIKHLKNIYVSDDGRILGPLYGQIFDLTANICRMLRLRLVSLDIVLEESARETDNEIAIWIKELEDRWPESLDEGPMSQDVVRIRKDAVPMVELLRSYYGAVRGTVPPKAWVVNQAIKTLFVQNRKAIEKLIAATSEQRQNEQRK